MNLTKTDLAVVVLILACLVSAGIALYLSTAAYERPFIPGRYVGIVLSFSQ